MTRFLTALLLGLALPAAALAQVPQIQSGLDVQLFKPVRDNNGFFTTTNTELLPHLDVNVNLFMNFARNPLELSGGSGERLVGVIDGITTVDLSASVGVFDVVDVSLVVPMTLNQDRSGILFASSSSESGVNDLELAVKYRFLDRAATPLGIAAGALLALTLPTGDPDNLLGASGVTLEGTALGDIALFGASVVLNLGYRLRTGEQVLLGDIEINDQLTYRLGAGYKLDVVPWLKKWEVMAELFGSTQASAPFAQERTGPIELIAGMRRYTDEQFVFTFGAGAGITSGIGSPDYRIVLGLAFYPFHTTPALECPEAPPPEPKRVCSFTGPEDIDGFEDDDGCPDPDNDGDGVTDARDRTPNEPEDLDGFEDGDGVPDPDNDRDSITDPNDFCPIQPEDLDGFEDADGCPEADNDQDGFADAADKCPLQAEDKDAFEDEDGCPDLDNDKDGVPDVEDNCPLEIEDRDQFEDFDGCPEAGKPSGRVAISGMRIEIRDRIFFGSGSSMILEDRSAPILEEIARVLRENRWIKRLEIQGHTDNIGDDAQNLAISQQRAEAVKQYLVNKGIEAERLVAQGYGETKPIDINTTSKGRAVNRRVEFVIIEGQHPVLFMEVPQGTTPPAEPAPAPPQ